MKILINRTLQIPSSRVRFRNDSCPIQAARAKRRATHNAAVRMRKERHLLGWRLEVLVERWPSRSVRILRRW
jgi:hypothetical protein